MGASNYDLIPKQHLQQLKQAQSQSPKNYRLIPVLLVIIILAIIIVYFIKKDKIATTATTTTTTETTTTTTETTTTTKEMLTTTFNIIPIKEGENKNVKYLQAIVDWEKVFNSISIDKSLTFSVEKENEAWRIIREKINAPEQSLLTDEELLLLLEVFYNTSDLELKDTLGEILIRLAVSLFNHIPVGSAVYELMSPAALEIMIFWLVYCDGLFLHEGEKLFNCMAQVILGYQTTGHEAPELLAVIKLLQKVLSLNKVVFVRTNFEGHTSPEEIEKFVKALLDSVRWSTKTSVHLLKGRKDWPWSKTIPAELRKTYEYYRAYQYSTEN